MKLITEILHEMGVDPDESERIEEEEESLRYIDDYINDAQAPLKKALKEKDKEIEELKRLLREKQGE
jgi:hypothetical protein